MELKNIKKRRRNFKIGKISYSKGYSVTKYDDNKSKPSLYP